MELSVPKHGLPMSARQTVKSASSSEFALFDERFDVRLRGARARLGANPKVGLKAAAMVARLAPSLSSRRC